MRKFSYFLALLLLSGCAGTNWSHRSKNEGDFNRDRAACNNEAGAANPFKPAPYNPYLTPEQRASQGLHDSGAQLANAFAIQSYFDNCMLAKGYVKR